MSSSRLISLLKLVRFDTSALAACIVFIPRLVWGDSLVAAAQKAFPILLISMSGFVLNDIHDIEKDKTNHPNRPLPTGAISKRQATFLYFFLLFFILLSIYAFVGQDYYFLYLLCLIAITNYNYIVDDYPYLKNFYVAFTSVLPIFILRSPYFQITNIDIVAVSILLFILGREILMDVLDLSGDGNTLARKLGEKRSTNFGFFVQFLAILLLFTISTTAIKLSISIVILTIEILEAIFWINKKHLTTIIHIMKIQMISGLIFLF